MPSEMERRYEAYLNSSNHTIELHGSAYYRIILKSKLSDDYGGMVLVTLPMHCFHGKAPFPVIDENGHHFLLRHISHFHFRPPIPQWYTQTLTISVANIHDLSEIGDYLSFLK